MAHIPFETNRIIPIQEEDESNNEYPKVHVSNDPAASLKVIDVPQKSEK